jgi:hypothetical protein
MDGELADGKDEVIFVGARKIPEADKSSETRRTGLEPSVERGRVFLHELKAGLIHA